MQNMILLLFAVFFTAGSYFILAEVFKVPTYRTSRAILTVGKKQTMTISNTLGVRP